MQSVRYVTIEAQVPIRSRWGLMRDQVIAAVLVLAVIAAALVGRRSVAAETDAEGNSSTPAAVDYRSPGLAFVLPLATTTTLVAGGIGLIALDKATAPVGLALAVVGGVLAPSVGHMYTGDWARVVGFSLGRAAAIGLLTAGFLVSLDNWFDEDSAGDISDAGAALAVIGGLAWFALSAAEASMSYHAAHAFNRRQHKAAARLRLLPLVVPPSATSCRRGPVLGLALAGIM